MAENEQLPGGWDGIERRQAPGPHELYRYIDEHVARQAGERLKVRTFADLQALVTIGVVLVGGIAWGLKIEARVDSEAKRREELSVVMARGILPVAEERIQSLTARLDRREQEAQQVMELIQEVQRECLNREARRR